MECPNLCLQTLPCLQVLEYVPETVYSVARQYQKSKQIVPLLFVKLYVYQLARALAHIHGLGICHRDIKPQNLLLDPETHILKLCDFGSAKFLVKGEPNVSYICSRYYRAPELIFGSTNYTTAIDIWSEGRWLVTCYSLVHGLNHKRRTNPIRETDSSKPSRTLSIVPVLCLHRLCGGGAAARPPAVPWGQRRGPAGRDHQGPRHTNKVSSQAPL